MKIKDILNESPMIISDIDFNLSNSATNQLLYLRVMKSGSAPVETSQAFNLYKTPREFIGIDNTTESVIYYMKWQEVFHKIIGKKAVAQVAVWAADSISSLGISKRIFFDYLLPTTGAVITDSQQTTAGKRFWINRVNEAFGFGYNVYIVLLQQTAVNSTPVLIKINSIPEFDAAVKLYNLWGSNSEFRARKIIISNSVI